MTGAHLFGRDDELRVLTGLIEAASDGGGAVLVRGEAGIGKSSLLRAACTYGRSTGAEVLHTTGVEAEAQLPFACLHQLLRPLLGRAGTLPARQRAALLAAFGMDDGAAPEPFMIALATLSLLADAAANRPVVVAVDDVQWLDRPTHEALAFVARRVGADPVVVIGTVRARHDGPLLGCGLPVLELAGLDDTAARQLIAVSAAGLPAASQERILFESLGNPLALVELPAAWRQTAEFSAEHVTGSLPLTARLEQAFAGRLAGLPPDTRDALLVAAVDNAEDLAEILAGAAALTGGPVSTHVWTPAVDAGLVRVDETRVVFRHPLVRSGILQVEPLPRRQAANAALAGVLADEPYRRVWHRSQSIVGPDDAVADDLEATHTIPLRRGAILAAITSLHRSAQLTGDPARRGHRLLLAAEHAFGLGRADLVDRLTAAADRCPLSTLDRARLAWLREIFNDGVPGASAPILRLCDAAQAAAAAGDRALALNLVHGASLRTWWAAAGREAQDHIVATVDALGGDGAEPRAVATVAVAHPCTEAERVLAALTAIVPEQVGDPAALHLYGMAAHAVGDPESAVDCFQRAERHLREQGRLGLLSQVLTMQVLDRLELGEWDRAVAAVEEARRLAADTGQPIWDTGSLSLNAIVESLLGDADVAHDMAGRAERAAGTQRLNNLLACVQLARGFGLIRAGRHTDAYHAMRRLFDPSDAAFHESERYHALAPLAEAARHAGLEHDARPVVARMAELAATAPAPTLLVHLDYARAVLAADEDAEPLYRAALARNLTRWPWHRARLELAYGSWLRRRRRMTESRIPLRAAHTTLELIGAATWAAQAALELRAAGERPAAAAPALHEVLTSQELQVARLAAQGLSNREIGERLYLSPRTISSILYRMFPKLNVTSRGQLAARLGRDGAAVTD
ncbi:helix-turn-helix transcriptional regulator [Dactylosporangium darangshiense]|uniref:LuxR family transcriptional regulator n=1 Tax=Dactylosporangium darangshiense TaxID=579108 RepID=A0ABP8DPN7_9ACTN